MRPRRPMPTRRRECAETVRWLASCLTSIGVTTLSDACIAGPCADVNVCDLIDAVTVTTMSTSESPAPKLGRATMRDVAALAGVSLKTVSRVVNRESGVSDDLRERVERAVERLAYTHNLTASNLRRSHGRTGVVGALVQDVSNSFSVGLLRSLEDAARERQCVVLAASIDEEPERERALVADLVARRVDGLILMPSTLEQSYLAAEVRAGLPTVFVDRPPR